MPRVSRRHIRTWLAPMRRASASGFFAPTNHPLDALPPPNTTTPTAHGEKTVTPLPGGATSTVHRMR